MSTPASARPNGSPLSSTQSGRLTLPPSQAGAQFIRRDGNRRKRGRRLGLEEPETLAEFGRDETAQGHVVNQHDQPDGRPRLSPRPPPWERSSTITAISPSMSMPQCLIRHADRFARGKKGIGAALIHQRIGPETVRHVGTASLADEFNMIDVGGSVRPLVGPRQRRQRLPLAKPVAERRYGLQPVRQFLPVSGRFPPNRPARPASSGQSPLPAGTASDRATRRQAARPGCHRSSDASFMSPQASVPV